VTFLLILFDSYKYAKFKESAQDPCLLLHVLGFRLDNNKNIYFCQTLSGSGKNYETKEKKKK